MLQQFLRDHGGPEQYLNFYLDTVDAKNAFSKWLWDYFPETDDVIYHHSKMIPAVEESQRGATLATVVHIAALGFTRECSIKPYPESKVAEQLLDQYLQDGFITGGDPLLCTQPGDLQWDTDGLGDGTPIVRLWAPGPDGDLLAPRSLGYIKGMARSCTALMMLHVCFQKGLNLKDHHPRLYASLLRVYIFHAPCATKRGEALANLAHSCRGAIRRPPNVMTFTGMAYNLIQAGDTDFTSFTRDWNSKSTKQFQIIGQKMMTMKLLIETVPGKLLADVILRSVGELGYDNCPFSEDNMASKKIYPGYSFKCTGSKKWAGRKKVTQDSFELHMRRVATLHKALLPHMRKKPDKVMMEEIAERAAVVWALGVEASQQAPIDPKLMQTMYYDAWGSGLGGIDVEVMSAVHECSDRFKLEEITVLCELLKSQKALSLGCMSNANSTPTPHLKLNVNSIYP